jgi:hypothetical protein
MRVCMGGRRGLWVRIRSGDGLGDVKSTHSLFLSKEEIRVVTVT